MADRPVTQYARTEDGTHLAYQVFGEGPDLLYCMGLWWHLDHQWDLPPMRQHLEQLGRFRQVIMFDRRGTGLSDRVPPERLPTVEERVDDVRTVLAAAGSERAAVLGQSHSADVAIALAALHPDQVEALLVLDGYARLVRTEDHPWGVAPAAAQTALERFDRDFAEPQGYERVGAVDDELGRQRFATMQRLSVSPGAAVALWRTAIETDVRHLLGRVQVPTLVVVHDPNRLIDPGCGRYVADSIAGARLVTLGPWRRFMVDEDDTVPVIEEFLTGEPAVTTASRRLAAVLFTDIVDSTARAASLGDGGWRTLLDEHDRLAGAALRRHDGRLVNPTGDGMLATFDLPVRAIDCARQLRDELGAIGLEIRAGVHTGEVEVRGDDLGGIAVHIGARIAALAEPGQILVSRTVADLIAGSGIELAPHGEHELKGIPGSWHVLAVSG